MNTGTTTITIGNTNTASGSIYGTGKYHIKLQIHEIHEIFGISPSFTIKGDSSTFPTETEDQGEKTPDTPGFSLPGFEFYILIISMLSIYTIRRKQFKN